MPQLQMREKSRTTTEYPAYGNGDSRLPRHRNNGDQDRTCVPNRHSGRYLNVICVSPETSPAARAWDNEIYLSLLSGGVIQSPTTSGAPILLMFRCRPISSTCSRDGLVQSLRAQSGTLQHIASAQLRGARSRLC
jgi:hypothetical protein